MFDGLEIYDLDTILYRACFAAEKKKYVLEVIAPSYRVLNFDNKKELNVYIRTNYADVTDNGDFYNVYIEHTVEPVENAIHLVKTILDGCHNTLGGFEQRYFLSGKGNFRYQIATVKPYKGNRDPKHKPVHLDAAREWAIKYLMATVVEGMEADDGVGILATNRSDSCVVSNDKDLRQLVGWHYDFVKKEKVYIGKREAGLYFFQQLLSGDPTDNIPGIEGLGEVGAVSILDGCGGIREAETRVLQAYRDKYGVGEGDRRFLETGRLVKIHTSEDEVNNLWYPKYVELVNAV